MIVALTRVAHLFILTHSTATHARAFLRFEHLQTILQATPIAKEGSKFIHAEVPNQGKETYDCGPWAAMYGLLYLMNFHTLTADFDSVTVHLLNEVDATAVGFQARQHMISAYKAGFNTETSPAISLSVSFS